MKPTRIKISISQDGLLPQQSVDLGEALFQGFPKKFMRDLDFEKVDDDGKKATFIGIMPVFVVIGEKSQEVEIELTVAHPELRDKVIDIFTSKPPAAAARKNAKTVAKKPAKISAKPKIKTSAPKKPADKKKTSVKLSEKSAKYAAQTRKETGKPAKRSAKSSEKKSVKPSAKLVEKSAKSSRTKASDLKSAGKNSVKSLKKTGPEKKSGGKTSAKKPSVKGGSGK